MGKPRKHAHAVRLGCVDDKRDRENVHLLAGVKKCDSMFECAKIAFERKQVYVYVNRAGERRDVFCPRSGWWYNEEYYTAYVQSGKPLPRMPLGLARRLYPEGQLPYRYRLGGD